VREVGHVVGACVTTSTCSRGGRFGHVQKKTRENHKALIRVRAVRNHRVASLSERFASVVTFHCKVRQWKRIVGGAKRLCGRTRTSLNNEGQQFCVEWRPLVSVRKDFLASRDAVWGQNNVTLVND
jgi:hypothetical protein